MSASFSIEDFTESNYKRLLQIAKEKFEFVPFTQARIDKPHVLWRHDCDFSIHRALRLAQLENEIGVSSTYFLLLHSDFYNVFEKSVFEKINEIISLNHHFGLHFDQSFWNIQNSEEMEKKIKLEKDILENYLQKELSAISFHNPIFNLGINIKNESYAGLTNAYSSHIFDTYKYVSDSNGYWRFDRLEDVLKSEDYRKLHILTHPEWWVSEPMTPRQRVQRCIDGRASAGEKNYDHFFVNKEDRLNVR